MAQNKNYSMARRPQRKKRLDNLTKGLLVAFVAVGLLLAFFGGKFVFNLVKGWKMTSLPGAPVAEVNPQVTATPSTSLQTNNMATAKAWDGKSRVNILLLGLDYSNERNNRDLNQKLTDTMMLVTIDPFSQTIGAMSIRRDLWVNIPEGFGYDKINTAYAKGEVNNLPGGGPALAVETVEQFLGITINYYAEVNLDSFIKIIDELGGVTVNIQSRMLADWKGDGNRFYIDPGTYTLPGSYALAYARCREDCGDDQGDIGRGSRQLEILNAVRNRIIRYDMLPQLISSAPKLYQDLSDGIKTNMSLDQALQLATLVIRIPKDNLKTYNIDYTMAEDQIISKDGYAYSVLIPYPDKIRILRDQMFADNGSAAAPIVTGNSDTLTLALQENARIQVLNGTLSGGLADTTAEYLKSKGFNVVGTSNGEATDYTTITLSGATPYSLNYIASLMQVPTTRIVSHPDANAAADIIITVGNDWQVPAQ